MRRPPSIRRRGVEQAATAARRVNRIAKEPPAQPLLAAVPVLPSRQVHHPPRVPRHLNRIRHPHLNRLLLQSLHPKQILWLKAVHRQLGAKARQVMLRTNLDLQRIQPDPRTSPFLISK